MRTQDQACERVCAEGERDLCLQVDGCVCRSRVCVCDDSLPLLFTEAPRLYTLKSPNR